MDYQELYNLLYREHGIIALQNEMDEIIRVVNAWISVTESLPEPLETVWISNGKGWTTLGCLASTPEGLHWAQTNGVIYQENGKIVSECESDDLNVLFWMKLPNPPTENSPLK